MSFVPVYQYHLGIRIDGPNKKPGDVSGIRSRDFNSKSRRNAKKIARSIFSAILESLPSGSSLMATLYKGSHGGSEVVRNFPRVFKE